VPRELPVPLHALELLPDVPGQDVVRHDWQRLRDAGLPSQLDHRGPTNAPHLTVLAAPVLPADDRAVALLAPLLPVTARASAVLLLGGRRLTVARAVDVPDQLVAAVMALRAGITDVPHQGWLPHVTLARRLERDRAQQAVDVLGWDDVRLTLTTLRRWNPDSGEATVLAQA
jgi:hypothetical protein